MKAQIASGVLPGARIEGSRIVPLPGAVLRAPAVSLAGARFELVPLGHGLVDLRDARGEACGVFASKEIAQRTVAFITR